MKRLSIGIILAAVLFSSTVYAEPFIVTVPGQSWQIAINVPPLEQYQAQTQGKRFVFLGKNAHMGFSISLFGEPWSSGGNPECRSAIWTKNSQNPMIDKASVKVTDKEKFSQVVYVMNADVKGQKVKQANADFFFVFKGNCVDVHLSKVPYQEGDEQILAKIGNSLGWGEASK